MQQLSCTRQNSLRLPMLNRKKKNENNHGDRVELLLATEVDPLCRPDDSHWKPMMDSSVAMRSWDMIDDVDARWPNSFQ